MNEALCGFACKQKISATRKATSRHNDEAESHAASKERNEQDSRKKQTVVASRAWWERHFATSLSSYINGLQTVPLSTHPTPTT